MPQRSRISREADRPGVPLFNPNSEEHRRQLANRANVSLPMDGSLSMQAPLVLAAFDTTELQPPYAPGLDPSLWEGGTVYVKGSGYLAVSDGLFWRVIGGPQISTAYNTSGNFVFTRGASVQGMIVRVLAGGAGGGQAVGSHANSALAGGGGGGGGYQLRSYTKTEINAMPATINLTVGSGGATDAPGTLSRFATALPGQVTSNPGSPGGSAIGGNIQIGAAGGLGGSVPPPSTGIVTAAGGTGGAGFATVGNAIGGDGGASHWGAGPTGSELNGNGITVGSAAVNAGAGGAGGVCVGNSGTAAGGAGLHGAVLIEEQL